jgi:hypothetical protein
MPQAYNAALKRHCYYMKLSSLVEHACSAERQLSEMWERTLHVPTESLSYYILLSTIMTFSVVVRLAPHHKTLGPLSSSLCSCLSEEIAEGLFDINHQ